MAIPGLCAAFRQRRLPLYFRRQAEDHRERPQRARNGELFPPVDTGGDSGRATAAYQGHYRAARRYRGIAVTPHVRGRPRGGPLSYPERPRRPCPGQGARSRENRGGLIPVVPAKRLNRHTSFRGARKREPGISKQKPGLSDRAFDDLALTSTRLLTPLRPRL